MATRSFKLFFAAVSLFARCEVTNLPEWIRVSVGTMDQNERFIAELRRLDSEGLLENRAAPRQPLRQACSNVLADDTIAAISTPPGEGAIAIIRISGSLAHAIAEQLFARENPGRPLSGAQSALWLLSR